MDSLRIASTAQINVLASMDWKPIGHQCVLRASVFFSFFESGAEIETELKRE